MLIVVFLIAACPNPNISDKGNSLTISITNAINARTLLPPLDMNATSFSVNGTGPGGATFSQTTSGGPVTVTGLAFGSWSVTVNALNAAGTIIGSGQATVTVHTAQTTMVAISVVPLEGNGTLNLSVTWTAAQDLPSIQATLTPPSGPAIPLSFSISGNQATYSSTTIPAGYQTLTVQLLDNGMPVMGAVEVARIVAGQTTTGTYAFANVNQPGGSVQVNITPAMADPIPVSIGGVSSTITAGTSMTATASVSDSTSNAVYVWYLNGVSQATDSSSYTFGSALAAGYYRLDVTAYTADGTRAGSATASVQVVAPVGSAVLTGPAPGTMGGQRAFDSHGNIYLFTYRGGLYKVTPGGTKTMLLSLSQIQGVPYGLLGSPLVLDDNTLLLENGVSGVMKLDLRTLALTLYAALPSYYYGDSNLLLDKNGIIVAGRTYTLLLPGGGEAQMANITGYMVYSDTWLYKSVDYGIERRDLAGNNPTLFSTPQLYMYGIAMGPDGSVYVGMGSGSPLGVPIDIYKLDPVSGVVSVFTTVPNWVDSLACDGQRYLYAAGFSGSDPMESIYRIDLQTGAVTLIP